MSPIEEADTTVPRDGIIVEGEGVQADDGAG